jgi:hypothetical protein
MDWFVIDKDSITGADKHYISCVSMDSQRRVFRLVGIVLKASDPQRVRFVTMKPLAWQIFFFQVCAIIPRLVPRLLIHSGESDQNGILPLLDIFRILFDVKGSADSFLEKYVPHSLAPIDYSSRHRLDNDVEDTLLWRVIYLARSHLHSRKEKVFEKCDRELRVPFNRVGRSNQLLLCYWHLLAKHMQLNHWSCLMWTWPNVSIVSRPFFIQEKFDK